MELKFESSLENLFRSKNFEKICNGGTIMYKFQDTDRTRVIELVENFKIILIYTYSETMILISLPEKFYEGINRFNEELNTLSVEYDPDNQVLRLKSSLINMPEINIEKAIEYYFKTHDKYFKYVNEDFACINEETNIEIIGKLIKEKSLKN